MNDFLFELIKSLSKKEKEQLLKYLDVFSTKGKNYPLVIFRLYITCKVYDELKYQLQAKCKSLTHFRKEKSKLKYIILDFLRISYLSKKDDKFANWRKEMDYSAILKLKGEYFWSEALNQIQPTIEETKESFSYAYTVIGIKELSSIYVKLLQTDFKDVSYYRELEFKSIIDLKFESELMSFFERVLMYYIMSKFIKNDEDDLEIKKLSESNFFKLKTETIENTYEKISLITAKICFYFLTNNEIEFKKLTLDLEVIVSQHDKEKWYFSNEFLTRYYFLLIQFLSFSKEYKKALEYIDLYRTSLSYLDVHSNTSVFDFKYALMRLECQLGMKRLTKNELDSFYVLFQDLDHQKNAQVDQLSFLFLIKAEYYFKNYSKVKALASQCYQISTTNKFSIVSSEIARIIELSAIFIDAISSKKLNVRLEEIKNIASFHYGHFIRKDNKYFLFEIKICSFMNSIDLKLKKNLKSELQKLKIELQTLQKEDIYGNIKKINTHYFDFYKWIDDCILLFI